MLRSLLTAFRQHYPQGSVVSNLVRIHDGLYIVRVAVTVEDRTLATGLAAHSVLETAEDNAYVRALGHIGWPEMGSWAPPSLAVPPLASSPPETSPETPPETVPESRSAPPRLPPHAAPPPAPLPTAKNGSAAQGSVPLGVDANPPANPPALDLDVDGLTSASAQIFEAPPAPTSPPLATMATATSFDPDLRPFEGIPTPSIDLSDIIAQTDVELQRLGWNVNQGREFLEKTYGKRSRHDLTDEELLEFLLFLETQPTPGPS